MTEAVDLLLGREHSLQSREPSKDSERLDRSRRTKAAGDRTRSAAPGRVCFTLGLYPGRNCYHQAPGLGRGTSNRQLQHSRPIEDRDSGPEGRAHPRVRCHGLRSSDHRFAGSCDQLEGQNEPQSALSQESSNPLLSARCRSVRLPVLPCRIASAQLLIHRIWTSTTNRLRVSRPHPIHTRSKERRHIQA